MNDAGAWTFPAVDTAEGITKITTGKLYTLSVQEIVDCGNGDETGCSGGFVSDAFDFINRKKTRARATKRRKRSRLLK